MKMATNVTTAAGEKRKFSIAPLWRRRYVHQAIQATFSYALLLTIGFAIVLPISWMLTAALRADGELVFTLPPSWFPATSWNFENFWRSFTIEGYPLWRYALNTSFLVIINVIGQCLSCSMVAYPFARLRFVGQNVLFTILISTMLIPYPVTLVPQFLLYNAIKWTNTYLPLTVPAFTGSAFLIFLVRQYMRSIPPELDDAALIDGCNRFQTYWRIILPLSSPVLVVVAIFTFLDIWNDFLGPLIYLNDQSKFTLAIGLQYFKQSVGTGGQAYRVEWNLLMAATLISILPVLIVYFAAQERLIGGISSVGLKG